MTCPLCQRTQADGFRAVCRGIDHVDECPTGEVPKLKENTRQFWWLFERILPGLCNPFGGFDFNAITSVCDTYAIEAGERPVIHELCLVVIEAIQDVREKEKNLE